MLLRSKDEEIARLRKIIEEMSREPKTSINLDNSDEWRIRFQELQNRHRRDIDNYEGELVKKDQIIMELRDRINQLLASPSPPPQTIYQTDDDLVNRLKSALSDRDREINYLRNELMNKKNTFEIAAEPPQVVRLAEPNLKEVRYEKDPYLTEQNLRLSKELEAALLEEQNAKNDLREKYKDIERLNDTIAQLKNLPPKTITKEVYKTQQVIQPTRIGDQVDRLFDMYKKNNDLMAKRLAQDMLYYYKMYMKYFRLAQKQRNHRSYL